MAKPVADLGSVFAKPGGGRAHAPESLVAQDDAPPAPAPQPAPLAAAATPVPATEAARIASLAQPAEAQALARDPKPKQERKTTTARIKMETAEGIELMMYKRRMTLQQIIDHALEAYLDAWNPNWRQFVSSP